MIFEFFTVCTKLAEMAILYSRDLTTAKKKLSPVGLDLMPEIITGLGVLGTYILGMYWQFSLNSSNLTKSSTLKSETSIN